MHKGNRAKPAPTSPPVFAAADAGLVFCSPLDTPNFIEEALFARCPLRRGPVKKNGSRRTHGLLDRLARSLARRGQKRELMLADQHVEKQGGELTRVAWRELSRGLLPFHPRCNNAVRRVGALFVEERAHQRKRFARRYHQSM